MKKKQITEKGDLGSVILQSKPLVLFIAVLSIVFGIFFIVSQRVNTPVPRGEAVSYSGEFEEYDDRDSKYKSILLTDGTAYSVYPHTETKEFRERMHSIPQGTVLYLLVNPNNGYVAEVRTDAEEILNFEASQEAIDTYDNGYIAIGAAVCVCGVLLIAYVIGSASYKRTEDDRRAKKDKKRVEGQNDTAIRCADSYVKHKILLEAKKGEYRICYRRVKSVNELVINGCVYDEKKGIIEFEHTLSAVLDGHIIEAGLDAESFSFIRFDGKTVLKKKRLI